MNRFRIFSMLLLLVLAISVKAQISGVVIDAQSGDTILYPCGSTVSTTARSGSAGYGRCSPGWNCRRKS